MKALTVSDNDNMIMALQDEIRRNDTSRYDHRLHGVLLVAQGMTCPRVAELLGDSPRTVVNWVQRFETDGLAGLSEGQRSGRPTGIPRRGRAAFQPDGVRAADPNVGWADFVRLCRAAAGREAKSEAVPAIVPATGLSPAQTVNGG